MPRPAYARPEHIAPRDWERMSWSIKRRVVENQLAKERELAAAEAAKKANPKCVQCGENSVIRVGSTCKPCRDRNAEARREHHGCADCGKKIRSRSKRCAPCERARRAGATN